MKQPSQRWSAVLGVLATPVLIVLALPLALVAALAMYGRALVMGAWSLVPRRRRKSAEPPAAAALPAPHFAEPSRIVSGEQGR